MSDIEDFAASYRNHEKAVAEANVINKGAVFDALSKAGIATLTVTFDGEGDSGILASLLLANLTAVIGFGVLATSAVPVLSALGTTVAPGALLALLFSAMLAPPASTGVK